MNVKTIWWLSCKMCTWNSFHREHAVVLKSSPPPQPEGPRPGSGPQWVKVLKGGSVPIRVQVWVGSSSNVASCGPDSHYV